MAIKLKFLGATRTVTGSSHLVCTDKSEVLIDGGLFQGRREQFYAINTTFSFNPHKVNAMILSHAHIDHCGNIPSLIKKGLRCKVYTTSATKDIARLMLEDSGKIQEEDVRYVNKINRRMGLPLRQPLYNQKEAAKATRVFRPLAYGQRFCVAKDIFATLHDAGHILGSAIIVLEIKDGQNQIKLGYAVDLGRKHLPFLNDPEVPKNLDYLMIESTYGARLHAPIEEAKIKLQEVVSRTIARKGKIIIPAFTLERTQEVIYFLNELVRQRQIPAVPIYVDSPLATDISDLFQQHLSYFNNETRQAIAQGNNPFELLNLKFIREQKDSKCLNTDKRPMIIMAGSGMCESGRILHHLKNNIEEKRNTILVVGYMAQDTLGRRIVEKVPSVRIFGIEYELNAEVAVINAFSGHADRNGLIEFVSGCLPLKRIFIVHGDMEQSQALQQALIQGNLNAYVPYKDEEVELN
ncbi:MAG: MBL fold metallo-hydrolase [Candidatus Omnitrophica bacterium]|nr:MBL fold metallo-hydrolase [Candidatus Omnitrophota bacterium]